MAKNYKNKRGVFARLLKANYVYKRVDVQHYAKGTQLKFAKVPFPKGPCFGNSFMVDGQLVSYRNLYPAPDPVPPRRARVAEPSRPRGSKYNLDKYVDQMVNAYMRLEEQMNARRSNGVPQRVAPPPISPLSSDDDDDDSEEEEEEDVPQRPAPVPPPISPLSSDDDDEDSEEEENSNDVVIPRPPKRNYSKQIQRLWEEAHHYTEHYNRWKARQKQQQRQQQSGSSNSRSSRRRR